MKGSQWLPFFMTLFSASVLFASALLIASYWFIPRRPKLGWALSFCGNFIYLFPVIFLHKLELLIVPVVFTCLSGWNLWRELHKKSSS
jgi:hypothetical protein